MAFGRPRLGSTDCFGMLEKSCFLLKMAFSGPAKHHITQKAEGHVMTCLFLKQLTKKTYFSQTKPTSPFHIISKAKCLRQIVHHDGNLDLCLRVRLGDGRVILSGDEVGPLKNRPSFVVRTGSKGTHELRIPFHSPGLMLPKPAPRRMFVCIY